MKVRRESKGGSLECEMGGREYEDLSGYSGRVPGPASAGRRPRGRGQRYDSAREYMGVLKKGEGKGKVQKAAWSSRDFLGTGRDFETPSGSIRALAGQIRGAKEKRKEKTRPVRL